MRITVECGGFTRAADACLTANQTSALLVTSLVERLAATSGMAGDDATSADFATAYDAGAREAVAALADLTHAFIGAGRLLAATGANHESAESSAGALAVLGYSGDGLHESEYVRVRPDAPPPSLGDRELSLSGVDAWILDQVEGFVWPGADVDRLRAAGTAWRRAAASTAGLADEVDVAITLVEAQHSPEVPLAVDALRDLATLVGDTAWQLGGLADACEDYADGVEATRDRTRALLEEVAQMIVEGAAISVIVTGLTGGLGGAASVAAAAAKVRSHAPRFYALLTALRAGVAATAARLERVRTELNAVRGRVEKFVRVPARNEVGALGPGTRAGGLGRGVRSRPDVENQKLKNYVDQLFKGVDNPRRTGDGTTMDAIRHELRTGETVHDRRHVIKGQETLRGLENWLRNNLDASTSDRDLARKLAAEIREALDS
ncbi:WXG100-like domain-containing protein [Nocardioides baculatus]|uniref:Outer membrane channel protein CpnT-like N-terminal domain-containing protein n=1 Tax=Nocardioides baculatus TaxID=2801337 RepID=A0ABS1LC46_9ACTN|nr:hypothetical protein [Nocardioides baculatus]MBL0749276.1 hypothetical protein [Nocardioides baculatus]